MSGSISERMEACSKIISKVAEHASNMANRRLKYESGNVTANDGGYNTGYEGSTKPKLKARVQVEIDVPNEMVGGILGAKGSIVRDYVQRSGARFDFSEKSEAPDRILTIKGDMGQINMAYSLVSNRLEELGKQHVY